MPIIPPAPLNLTAARLAAPASQSNQDTASISLLLDVGAIPARTIVQICRGFESTTFSMRLEHTFISGCNRPNDLDRFALEAVGLSRFDRTFRSSDLDLDKKTQYAEIIINDDDWSQHAAELFKIMLEVNPEMRLYEDVKGIVDKVAAIERGPLQLSKPEAFAAVRRFHDQRVAGQKIDEWEVFFAGCVTAVGGHAPLAKYLS